MKIKNKKLTIFMYHQIIDNPSQFCIDFHLNVKPIIFQKQIDWISKKYTIINPKTLVTSDILPDNAALITFDDGFKGAFQNGLSYLESKCVPSIMFLNMGHIIEKTPLISSAAIYFSNHYNEYLLNNEKFSFYLNVTPNRFLNTQIILTDIEKKRILDYQGSLADLDLLTNWENSNYVYYGNHLYEHYNSTALTNIEFTNSYIINNQKLSKYKNFINYFSFPNGKPLTCFNDDNLIIIKNLNCKKVFYSSGSINNSNHYLLDRIDFTDFEYNIFKMNFRIFLSKIKPRILLSLFQKFRKVF